MTNTEVKNYIKNVIIDASNLLEYDGDYSLLFHQLKKVVDDCNNCLVHMDGYHSNIDVRSIYNNMTPWQQDVFDLLDALPNKYITLSQVYSFNRILQKLHPDNHHVNDKIRQILQQLRDLGLLEFEGDGEYIILWK